MASDAAYVLAMTCPDKKSLSLCLLSSQIVYSRPDCWRPAGCCSCHGGHLYRACDTLTLAALLYLGVSPETDKPVQAARGVVPCDFISCIFQNDI